MLLGTRAAQITARLDRMAAEVGQVAAKVDAKAGAADGRLSDARPPLPHDHDGRYYTRPEVDALLASRPSGEPARFPVGYVWLSADDVNPATHLGYGTWKQLGNGSPSKNAPPYQTCRYWQRTA